MSRLQVPSFTPGDALPAEVNAAFTRLKTALNNTANGGNSVNGENFDPGAVPPEVLSKPYTIQVIPVLLDEEEVVFGGKSWSGYEQHFVNLEKKAVTVPVPSILIGYSVYGDTIPGHAAPGPHTMRVLRDGTAIGAGISWVNGLQASITGTSLAVAKGQTLAVRITLNVGAAAHFYKGRAWLYLKAYGWR